MSDWVFLKIQNIYNFLTLKNGRLSMIKYNGDYQSEKGVDIFNK